MPRPGDCATPLGLRARGRDGSAPLMTDPSMHRANGTGQRRVRMEAGQRAVTVDGTTGRQVGLDLTGLLMEGETLSLSKGRGEGSLGS